MSRKVDVEVVCVAQPKVQELEVRPKRLRATQAFRRHGTRAAKDREGWRPFPAFNLEAWINDGRVQVATSNGVFTSDGIGRPKVRDAINRAERTGDWKGFAHDLLEYGRAKRCVRSNPGFSKAMEYVVAGDPKGLEEWAATQKAVMLLTGEPGGVVWPPRPGEGKQAD